jgi:histone acetyltransferase
MKDEKTQATSIISPLICETGLGFSARDKNIKTEEDKGQIEFNVIKNDGNLRNLKLLTDLKNIIAKQLPKMPKEYIVRLVFDKKHESMIIKKNNVDKVIGGVCYRPNYDQGFIEIAFLAISSLEQVKVNLIKINYLGIWN